MTRRAAAIIVIIFLLSVLAGAYWALNSARFTEWFFLRAAKKDLPHVSISSLQISGQQFRFPNQFVFQGIKAVVIQDKVSYTLEASALKARGLLTMWRPKNDLHVTLEGFQVSSSAGSLRDFSGEVDAALVRGQIRNLTGNIRWTLGRWGPYELYNVSSVLGHRDKSILLKNFSAEAYGAKFNGEISLEYPSGLSYSMQIAFKDLDAGRLRPLNDSIPTQIEGVFNGTLTVAGRGSDIEHIDLQTQIVRGGKIRASLLSFVTQYMPSSRERSHLEKVLQSNGKVKLEKASVQLKSVSKDKLTALVKLFSRELNLDQNFVIDINSDGKLTTLLDYADRFSIK